MKKGSQEGPLLAAPPSSRVVSRSVAALDQNPAIAVRGPACPRDRVAFTAIADGCVAVAAIGNGGIAVAVARIVTTTVQAARCQAETKAEADRADTVAAAIATTAVEAATAIEAAAIAAEPSTAETTATKAVPAKAAAPEAISAGIGSLPVSSSERRRSRRKREELVSSHHLRKTSRPPTAETHRSR